MIYPDLPDYTHEIHARATEQAAQRRQVLQQHVLVKKGQIRYCAVIRAPWTTSDGKECWTVEALWPEQCRFTVSTSNVVECRSDKCSCQAAAERQAQRAGGGLEGAQK